MRETADGVEVTDGNGRTTSYDAVVIATHPDQALAMLQIPTAAQREALAAMPYSDNSALLHTDESLLPARRAGAGVVELPAPARRPAAARHGHLRPHPSAAAAHQTRTTS